MNIDVVLDGMECCREMDNPPGYRFRTCGTCPYKEAGCVRKLKDDVIEILRKMKGDEYGQSTSTRSTP